MLFILCENCNMLHYTIIKLAVYYLLYILNLLFILVFTRYTYNKKCKNILFVNNDHLIF